MSHRFVKDVVEGRGPVTIELDRAAYYEKMARRRAEDLSYARSPAYRSLYGYRPGDEEDLKKDEENYRKLAREALARALEEEVNPGSAYEGNPSRPFLNQAGGPPSRRQSKRR